MKNNKYSMKTNRSQFLILVLMIFGSISSVYAQSNFIRSLSLEDYYRNEQLSGNFNPDLSFVIRPLYEEAFKGFGGDLNFDDKLISFEQKGLLIGNKTLEFYALPVEIVQQFNSHHPEGFNDGSMIPAKGYQAMISAGIYAAYGPLHIQLNPEFVFAENKAFSSFSEIYAGQFLIPPTYLMDLPEKFGEANFNKMFWGQSSIRLNYRGLSLGISNENLWWGPGQRNTLLMTNTAPGFKHLTFNTVRPVKTGIGSFEGQIIAGRLEGSGYNNLPDDWRYLNALILSYQPKWIPGLFLGMIRSFQVYHHEMGNSLNDYLPVFIPVGKDKAGGSNEDFMNRDQLLSFFMRWLWVESQAEIYLEYGREDHAWDNRDLMLQLSHTSAYVLGFTKLLPLNFNTHETLKINFELSQLEANPTTKSRSGGSWYQHGQVRHGYTHQGQLLGAGIGPGSNLQTLNLSWLKSYKKIGVQFERFVHNNDFWYSQIKDYRANWVDLSAAIIGNWNYRNLIFNFNFKFVKSINYQWLYTPASGGDENFWEGDGNDVFNFHARVGLMYCF